MKLFDTHCHFETTDESLIRATLARAKAAGVEALMAVGGSDVLNASACVAQRLAHATCAPDDFPRVLVALGFDREQIGMDDSMVRLRFSSLPSPAAIGEIGLDYHYASESREDQMKLFGAQLQLANEKNLPVVIHTREADDDTLGLLREIPSRGIIHCYTGTPEAVTQFLNLGFYISFSGIVTFRAADNVRAAARVVPNDRILIETDAPFLAPVPLRGKSNEPAFVAYTCSFLARERGLSQDAFAALTFDNAVKVLGHTC